MGLEKGFQEPVFATNTATRCCVFYILRMGHFFSLIFKALDAEKFVSYCFIVINTYEEIFPKSLTVGAYGHNLGTTSTQHLVSDS